MNTAVTVAQVAGGIATALAVLVGGAWAYLRFARRRLFAQRAELGITAVRYERADGLMAVVTVTLANRSVRRLRLKPGSSVLFVFRLDPRPVTTPTLPAEERVAVTQILNRHDWLETDEQVTHDVTILLPGGGGQHHPSFRLEAQVWSMPRRIGPRQGVRWISSAMVPGTDWTVKDGL